MSPTSAGKSGTNPNKKEKGKRRGGWQPSSRLNWRRDVRAIDGVAHDLAKMGFGFTHMVTITPLSGSPPTRKRIISRAVAHLGQALKRRGHEHVGLTIIEHPIDRDLHGHHLLHVHRSEYVCIERWRSCQADIDVKPITDLNGLLRYVLKERRRLSPAFEARIKAAKGPLWRKCRPVPGKRWSITTDAKVLLTETLSDLSKP